MHLAWGGPVEVYKSMYVEGWALKVESGLVQDQPELWSSVRRELQTQLYRIAHIVPDDPLKKLRLVRIWVHLKAPVTACMAYHPGAEYLSEHKMNPEMAKGVEIGDANNFVSWTYEQPWMLMHELAHAFHDRFLDKGFENDSVMKAYREAVEKKSYESVLHWDGASVRHYALTNQMEYFAETTEAYFGHNDFYPFVNAELKTFDPVGLALMKQVWGEPQKRK